ncbi:LIM and calponin-like proteiny domains-containing protein 1-like protein [Sarcoptes scabiei]|uniref:LIM and calponin-like proteiny domains-containing protein 1-like protein n=1 Tax=Sarcoptes scabiei TaxID=52283 RepID=A0A132AHH0_SARSC|nr:LIM and calponin-like proteiny domains-containing protein 1-like protein [Sarcoptes scabiei]
MELVSKQYQQNNLANEIDGRSLETRNYGNDSFDNTTENDSDVTRIHYGYNNNDGMTRIGTDVDDDKALRLMQQQNQQQSSDFQDESHRSASNVHLNTTLLEEFSCRKTENCDNNQNSSEMSLSSPSLSSKKLNDQNKFQQHPSKVHVPINDWKSQHSNSEDLQQQQHHRSHQSQHQIARKNSSSFADDSESGQQQSQQLNSSFEIDDDEELDEELRRLRLDQERSFKAKLHTFEVLAKQEEEAARRAAEANLKRQQNRAAKLAAERSKSLSNINAQSKQSISQQQQLQQQSKKSNPISVSSSSIQSKSIYNNFKTKSRTNTADPIEDDFLQNYQNRDETSGTSVVYNFKDKQNNSQIVKSSNSIESGNKSSSNKMTASGKEAITKSDNAQSFSSSSLQNPKNHLQSKSTSSLSTDNIYENVPNMVTGVNHGQSLVQDNHPSMMQTPPTAIHQCYHRQSMNQSPTSPSDSISDTETLRSASQKLLQQQQQIYQNQPLPNSKAILQQPSISLPPISQSSNDHYSNLPSLNYGSFSSADNYPLDSNKRFTPINDDNIGLPSIQITKTIQTISPDENPVYQNHPMLINQQNYHNYENSYGTEAMMMMPRRDDLVSLYPPQPMRPHLPTEPYHQNPLSQSSLTNPSHQYQSHYLYYPKPYTGSAILPNQIAATHKQISMKQSNLVGPDQRQSYGSNGYNPNHWVIQEAELRQSNQRLQQQQQQQQSSNSIHGSNSSKSSHSQQHGYLSVSGKKKCSKCGDELGKGCAAMVVESLSLYYHINCFRCFVCNVQLGNDIQINRVII